MTSTIKAEFLTFVFLLSCLLHFLFVCLRLTFVDAFLNETDYGTVSLPARSLGSSFLELRIDRMSSFPSLPSSSFSTRRLQFIRFTSLTKLCLPFSSQHRPSLPPSDAQEVLRRSSRRSSADANLDDRSFPFPSLSSFPLPSSFLLSLHPISLKPFSLCFTRADALQNHPRPLPFHPPPRSPHRRSIRLRPQGVVPRSGDASAQGGDQEERV